jgi:hypothetical protein
LPGSFEPEITGTYCQRLTDTGSGVVEKKQQCMISLASTALAINGADHSAGFFGFQIDGRPPQGSLVATRENPTVLTCTRHIVPQEVVHKTANGRKTAIPRNSRVPASRFDMIQEREYDVGLNILKSEVRHWFSLLIRQKQEEELTDLRRIGRTSLSARGPGFARLQTIPRSAVFGEDQ